jgi:tetratricopeptide (TPR) repeat protein
VKKKRSDGHIANTQLDEKSANVFFLEHDITREASNVMRGYRYQILCAVKEWLFLEDRQRLYLEGAEDFDKLGDIEAETTQVKDTPARSLTLKSSDVVGAINNFWDLKQKNPSRQISFQFLSTSTVTFERGKPFDEPGLELWNRIRKTPLEALNKELGNLKSFLLELSLKHELKTFIRNCSLKQLRDELVLPIQWVLSAPNSDGVESEILDTLIEYGLKTSRCKRLLHSLYYTASERVTKSKSTERYLTKQDFRDIFENATTERVNSDLLAKLLEIAVKKNEPSALGVSGDSILSNDPPLPLNFFRRRELNDKINRQLDAHAVCILQGITGSGKTSMVADVLANRSSKWLNLREYNSERTLFTLKTLEQILTRENLKANIVIEDLNSSSNFRQIEAPLIRIASLLKNRGCWLLITSEGKIADRIIGKLALDSIIVTPFSEEEIVQFLKDRAFPSEQLISQWAPLLLALTSGHPQLLQARVAHLVKAGYPAPDVDLVLSSPKNVEDVYTEARTLISSLDEPSNSLLYRLGLTIRPLSRQQIIEIGLIEPKIDSPGQVLDMLAPWVEDLGENNFRISPLAKNVGIKIHGKAWAERTHSQIAFALLKARTLTQDDVAEILFHTVAGDRLAQMVWIILVKDLIKQENDVLAAIYRAFPLIGDLAVHDGTSLDLHEEVLPMFRILQYRLAVAGGGPLQSQIIARFDRECPRGTTNPNQIIPRFMWVAQRLQVDMAMSLAGVFEIASELFDMIDTVAEPLKSSLKVAQYTDWHSTFKSWPFFCIAQRINSANDLGSLLNLLNAKPDFAKELLTPTDQNESIAAVLRFKILRHARDLDVEEKDGLLKIVEELRKSFEEIGLTSLPQICACISLEILCDHLGKPTDALAISDQFSENINNSTLVKIVKARILAINKNDRDATILWSSALEEITADGVFDEDYLLAFRECACAFARLGDHLRATEYFQKGISFCTSESSKVIQAGLYFDTGQSCLLDGQLNSANEWFRRGADALLSLRKSANKADLLVLENKANYLIAWNSEDDIERASKNVLRPPEGFCSSVTSFPEVSHASPPPELILYNLVKFEFRKINKSIAYQAYRETIKATLHPGVSFLFAEFELQYVFAQRDRSRLVQVILAYIERLSFLARQPGYDVHNVSIEFSDFFIVVHLLATSLIQLNESGKIDQKFVSSIDIATRNSDYHKISLEFCTALDEFFLTKRNNPHGVFLAQNATPVRRLIAAFAVVVLIETTPEHLLIAQMTLLESLGQIGPKDSIASDLVKIFERSWIEMAKSRHLFPSPKTAIPAIQNTIATVASPWGKIKLLLTTLKNELPGAKLGASIKYLENLSDE